MDVPQVKLLVNVLTCLCLKSSLLNRAGLVEMQLETWLFLDGSAVGG